MWGGFVLLALAAYYPAWHGGILWDDDRHLTSPALQSAAGLWRIWFELGATQQYYPLTHSAFWLLHRVAGDGTTIYHLANIVLHASSGFLLAWILRRLQAPGALIAGLLFTVHPVHVESVAWMTELKNTLSGFFCLLAALAWVRFDDRRDRASYATAFVCFVLALLSKSVTAMLPIALLLVAWWRRGAIGWKRDVRPLMPMLVTGAAAGLFTAWVERTIIRAQGAEYDLNVVERCLVAGRATWFYLTKLFVPYPLTFIYPRWDVSDAAWVQYAFPLGALALGSALWAAHRRWRAPLACYVAFCVLLFPALGFFNVYPFRFSYVADHFQYLASMPVLALCAAGLAMFRGRVQTAAVSAVLLALAGLTFAQSRDYTDATTLWRTTLERNPRAWIAAVNVGVIELPRDPDAAAGHFRAAIAIKPDIAEAHSNLGNAAQRLGDLGTAVREYREAIRLAPELAEAHNNLANALFRLGRADEAATAGADAARLDPENADAHFNYGAALHALGKTEQATNEFAAAVRLRPDMVEAHNYLGILLQTMGHDDDALAEYGLALRLQPTHAGARFNAANLLQAHGRLAEAIAQYQALIALTPGDAAAHNNFGAALEAVGRTTEALAEYATAARLDPMLKAAQDNVRRLSK